MNTKKQAQSGSGIVLLACLLLLLAGCDSPPRVPEEEILPPTVEPPFLDKIPTLMGRMERASNDFEKTILVREFVASHVDFGGDSILTSELDANWWRNNSVTTYEKYTTRQATGNAITTATFLRRLLFDMEYISFDLDIGVDGQIRHCLNLVEIVHNDEPKLIIQDATFNHTYTDTLGNPWDFFDLLEELKKEEFSNIVRRYADFNPVPGVLQKTTVIEPGSFTQTEGWTMEHSGNERYPYRVVSPRKWERYLEAEKPNWGPLLEANGYPQDPIYLLFFPINLYGDFRTEMVKDRIWIALGKKQQEVELPKLPELPSGEE